MNRNEFNKTRYKPQYNNKYGNYKKPSNQYQDKRQTYKYASNENKYDRYKYDKSNKTSEENNKANSEKKHSIYNILMKKQKLLEGKVVVNGKELRAVYDTGATISMMSKKTADALKIQIKECTDTINTADGSHSVLGITDNMLVEVEDIVTKINFYIASVEHFEILLGLNWFEQTNVQVDPANRQLIIPGRMIAIDNEAEQEDDEYESVLVSYSDEIEEKQIESFNTDSKNEGVENQLKQLAANYKHLFVDDMERLTTCISENFTIDTTNNTPVMQKSFRLPQQIVNEMKQQVTKMLKAGIVSRGKAGTWASPAFLKKEKSGYRFIVDYRHLNPKTVAFLYPLPRIDDIIDKLSSGRIFSTIDIKKAFNQIKIAEKDKYKTGFITPFGIFQYNRLPFGLRNAPAFFSHTMQSIFGHLDFVEIYIDDLIIFSETVEKHLEHIKQIFDIVEKYNIKLNPEKCQWGRDTIKILGHIISSNEIKMLPDKITVIRERKPPRNLKELQSILGLFNYYRKFIHNFAHIAAPLI